MSIWLACMSTHYVHAVQLDPVESDKFSVAGVTDSSVSHRWVLGVKPRFSIRATTALNC